MFVTQHNERMTYIAKALDRVSTSCLTVGVFAPIAAAIHLCSCGRVPDIWLS